MMHVKNVFNLPSGRIFLLETEDNSLIECTEMRDVATKGKLNEEVRNSTDPHVIWNHLVPYSEKWLLTVSTQKGCVHKCKFCDVPTVPYKGNLSADEIKEQIQFLIDSTPYVKTCKKVKIGFARMGEPAHNLNNVLNVISTIKSMKHSIYNSEFTWLPCFNSILPVKTIEGNRGEDVIQRVMYVKEAYHDGFLHFQISCNSTDEEQRKQLFGGAEVLPLPTVIKQINLLKCTNRTVTLNFIVMDGVEVDPEKLLKMGISPERFTIKLIPLNQTDNSLKNNLKTYANYATYDKLAELSEKFEKLGLPVVYDSIARCEEAGLCCGQLARVFCNKQGV